MTERIKPFVPAVLVAALVLGMALPATAEDEPKSSKEHAEELAREGADRLMEAFDTLLKSIPQYGMPRIDEDGDIVIPRLDKPEERERHEKPPAKDVEPFIEETSA